ncbi:MAG: amidohydrolase family protein [Bacillus subtilis]|nr:amidohydrolase family protein [Bacillus subtilis]
MTASGSVLVRDGKIARVITGDAGQPDAAVIIDVTGMVVMPGLVDMHTHLREPGYEHKETIRDGNFGGRQGRLHRRPSHAEHEPGQ